MKNTLYIILIMNFVICKVFSYEASLEHILDTSPNIEAMEFVFILNNNFSRAQEMLETARAVVEKSDASDLHKKIKNIHLDYLSVYSHRYHISDLSKKERNNVIFQLVENIRTEGKKIIEKYPKYADLRWVMAASTMILADTGSKGLSKFMMYRNDVINYVMEAVRLDNDNPMARVVINNFDSRAPHFIGGNERRGLKLITIPIHKQWKNPQKFEFYMSQYYGYKRAQDKEGMDRAFKNAQKLYPQSWRLKTLL